MQAAPISAAELLAWCQGTQTQLEPFEFELIQHTSRAFVNQLANKDAPDPTAKPE